MCRRPHAGPRNEHSKARTLGPHPLRGYPAYVLGYVAGSASRVRKAARRSELGWHQTATQVTVLVTPLRVRILESTTAPTAPISLASTHAITS